MGGTVQVSKTHLERNGSIWPSIEYNNQVAQLRQCAGQQIYLLEVNLSEIYITLTHIGRSLTLLDVIDFPNPDPEKYLYPHMLITDDGRGINLGRVARVSLNQPFMPEEKDIVYQEPFLLQRLAYCDRSISKRSICLTSKIQLGKIIERRENELVSGDS
ncbi:MAG: hypothetical protein OEY89_06555 [Gammaproteobacteria bacterium]|nr:hypothetical protein [Gammaproteobacteria bacterium]